MKILNLRFKKIICWVLQIILTLQFIANGLDRLTSPDNWERRFSNWGYPNNFFYFVGIIEIILAIGLITPKLIRYSLISTSVLMIPATITHLIAQDGHFWVPLITGLIALTLLLFNKKK